MKRGDNTLQNAEKWAIEIYLDGWRCYDKETLRSIYLLTEKDAETVCTLLAALDIIALCSKLITKICELNNKRKMEE